MKSSIVLASLCATAAMAGPHKRGLHTEWVYETVTVTVTGGVEPTTLPVTPSAAAAGQFFDAGDAATTTPAPVPSVEVEPEPQPQPELESVSTPAPTPEQVSSPVPTESTPLPEISSDYKEASLQYHNVHRANHSAENLVWSTDLADRANLIVLGCTGHHVMNQGPNDYGQNLQSMSTPKDAPSSMGTSWYNNEMSLYRYYGEEPPMAEVTKWGHFTAMVWANTKEVGCATAWCDKISWVDDDGHHTEAFNNYWTVCNYRPAGNVVGAFRENVRRPRGQATF